MELVLYRSEHVYDQDNVMNNFVLIYFRPSTPPSLDEIRTKLKESFSKGESASIKQLLKDVTAEQLLSLLERKTMLEWTGGGGHKISGLQPVDLMILK